MGSYPFGPHGPQTRPYDPVPNPTPAYVPPSGGGDFGGQATGFPSGGGGTYTGPVGGGSGGPFLSFTVSLLMIPFVWMFWICLYPLTATVAAVVWTGVAGFSAAGMFSGDRRAAFGFGFICAYIACIIFSRVEFKLAQVSTFRYARHIVRLILFGIIALPWIAGMMADEPAVPVMLRIFSQPRLLIASILNPIGLAVIGVVMLGMHFLLLKATGLRNFWHRRLMWIGLK